MQQWLHDRASLLHYTYFDSLAVLHNNLLKTIQSEETVHILKISDGTSNTSKSKLQSRGKKFLEP